MLAAERCLLHLLSEYIEELEKLKGIRPTTPELDTTAFAILLLCAEYKKHFTKRSEIISLLKDSQSLLAGNGEKSSDHRHVSSMPSVWTLSDQFPFSLAEATLTFENSKVVELAAPYYLVGHHQSDVRQFCLRGLWLARKELPRAVVIKALCENLTYSNATFSASVCIARALYDSDEEFFDAAEFEDISEDFKLQFQGCVESLKEDGSLEKYQNLFLPFELTVREKIEQTALLAEWPVSPTPAVQLKLPVN